MCLSILYDGICARVRCSLTRSLDLDCDSNDWFGLATVPVERESEIGQSTQH